MDLGEVEKSWLRRFDLPEEALTGDRDGLKESLTEGGCEDRRGIASLEQNQVGVEGVHCTSQCSEYGRSRVAG